ncbi:MAG: T9SS type A sorting domain-containing protein [Candidatus Zixiibacteriota bacterium]
MMKKLLFIILITIFLAGSTTMAANNAFVFLTGPDTVLFIQNFYTGLVMVETPETLGGAALIFNDSIEPVNLQPQMIMGYEFLIDNTTHVNFYSYSNQVFYEGPLLSFTGDGILIDVDASDSSGTMLTSLLEVITDVNDNEPEMLPRDLTLAQNYPNPFNAGTRIEFSLEMKSDIKLEVMDITGKIVSTIFRGTLPGGTYAFDWQAVDDHGRDLPSGVYLYRLKTAVGAFSRKMLLLK